MKHKLIFIGLFVLIGCSLVFAITPQEQPTTLVKTQNYLSTPYLANPNNQFVDAELEIITIGDES